MYKIWDINVCTAHVTDTQCMLHLYSDVQKTNIIFVNGTYIRPITDDLTYIMADLVMCVRSCIKYSLMQHRPTAHLQDQSSHHEVVVPLLLVQV